MSHALHFTPRSRRPMEALDLGLSLLQAHRGAIYRVFLLQMGMVLALLLPFTWKRPAWTLAWLLWLAPWLNRGTLHVLSRAIFGQPAGIGTFLQQFGAIHRRGLLSTLLWRRLSPTASFLLPLWQLEGQGGQGYRQRARVLLRQGGGTAFLLGLLCTAFALVALYGSMGLFQLLMPRGLPMDLWENPGQALARPWFNWLFAAFGWVALALTEPYFAAAGFALYLNRRTQLEGWDLEHAFRNLAERLRRKGKLCVLLIGLGLALGAQTPPPSVQPDTPRTLQPDAPARKDLEALLARDPDLRRNRTERVLRYRPTGREPRWLRGLLDLLFAPSDPKRSKLNPPVHELPWWNAAAWVLKLILISLLIGLVLYLITRFHAARLAREGKSETYEVPETLAGLDVREHSLPADVPEACLRLFRAGDGRSALSLLYRATLADLLHRHHLPIPASATEGDCLRLAEPRLDAPGALALRELTVTWMRMAYSELVPQESEMVRLCTAWRASFGRPE